VQYIYSSVVDALERNPARRFIFVETAFFMRWWKEQNTAMHARVKALVSAGQIEVVNGAWCMADDASPSLDAEIDQVTLGHRYMRDVLGVVPKYAWHIDPFGLSASYAMMWGGMNYTGWLLNRVDTRLKDLWHNQTRLQFQWQPQGKGPNTTGVFSHVLDTHYGSPAINYKNLSFKFDWEDFNGLGGASNPGNAVPVSQAPPSPFYNATAPDEAEAFAAVSRLRAGWYNNL
jgi:hypothetical protein